MPQYILDKAYKIIDPGGVDAFRVVVQAANAGNAMLPPCANVGTILGTTVHGQSVQGMNVGVRKAGIARVIAAGPIDVGDPVNVADAMGRVKSVYNHHEGGDVNCLGFAETAADKEGDVIEVFISLHERAGIIPRPISSPVDGE